MTDSIELPSGSPDLLDRFAELWWGERSAVPEPAPTPTMSARAVVIRAERV